MYIFRGYTGINAKDSDDGREALLWSWRSIKVLSCICSGILCDFEIAATFSLQEEAKRFSSLKVGFRGDLKFQEHPDIIELAPLLERQQRMGLKLTQS